MKSMTLTILCCLAIGQYAQALDKPPDSPKNQRPWLRRCLLSDISEIDTRMPGTFAAREYVRAKAISNPGAGSRFRVSDDDVALLADYYYRTRARAEEDLRQFQRLLAAAAQFQGQLPNPQPAGPTDEELKVAKADREAISALGGDLADKTDAVKGLSQLIYASLPGFCLRERQMLPASYFDLDQAKGTLCYVGPVDDSGYAGPYATPISISINASAGRRAFWLRHVLLWHHSQNPTAHLPGGGTANGNTEARNGVNVPRSGAGTTTGYENMRGPISPSASLCPIGNWARRPGRNSRNQ